MGSADSLDATREPLVQPGLVIDLITNDEETSGHVAAHDIGAIGYFASRELVDLAGLVSPDVIPFIREESALATYLDEAGAEYLITFPSWYPELTAGRQPLFVTGAPYSPAAGGENMTVYAWKR